MRNHVVNLQVELAASVRAKDKNNQDVLIIVCQKLRKQKQVTRKYNSLIEQPRPF